MGKRLFSALQIVKSSSFVCLPVFGWSYQIVPLDCHRSPFETQNLFSEEKKHHQSSVAKNNKLGKMAFSHVHHERPMQLEMY
jgi:hypothetical protein